ncbi:putative transcriptional regulator, IclR family protein [Mycolicibacterium chitae]|uniref:Transcriptional regulator n=1 Tax=Mycolicibacterium chitae TaxID=1792 RepID=A0A3S4SB43_MYCCI|nr:helix-turn-helix domain-containing protein [Mycolicibacterium chitae]MCV7104445.1 helix-turn-helix domain-containing protein [Mycolicibacterium chitae]BBZ05490.1 putative transcriptional regulator, IclR family protein [Mycolicibacterium chitae]VEG49104.1 transcriptional regulator [Mycolicibacterium chitae]
MATSAPTERVLDILEFVARRNGEDVRFSDVARELKISQGTANAILNSLCERGWLVRDPQTKAYGLGPGLAAVAATTATALPLTHAAKQAATELANDTGLAASVVELVGDALVIIAFEGGDGRHPAGLPGERIPYAPPFGVAFAAWAEADEQRAWMARNPGVTGAVARRLRGVLQRARERGYDVDWTTPVLMRMSQFLGEVRTDADVSDHVVAVLEKALLDCAKVGYLSDDDPAIETQPVATIAAPIFDAAGQASLILGVHPGRPLPFKEIRRLGTTVAAAAARCSIDHKPTRA